jgi:putative DNA primase/helicase
LDIKEVAKQLNTLNIGILKTLFPNGKLKGREYIMGDIHGAPGASLSFNVDTGMWADFASNVKGGDIISLYAAHKNISQLEAAKYLCERSCIKVDKWVPKLEFQTYQKI